MAAQRALWRQPCLLASLLLLLLGLPSSHSQSCDEVYFDLGLSASPNDETFVGALSDVGKGRARWGGVGVRQKRTVRTLLLDVVWLGRQHHTLLVHRCKLREAFPFQE